MRHRGKSDRGETTSGSTASDSLDLRHPVIPKSQQTPGWVVDCDWDASLRLNVTGEWLAPAFDGPGSGKRHEVGDPDASQPFFGRKNDPHVANSVAQHKKRDQPGPR